MTADHRPIGAGAVAPSQAPAPRWVSQFAFDSHTVDRIRERAPLLAPLLVFTALNLAVALAMREPLTRALAGQPQNVRQGFDLVFWVAAVFALLLVLVKALALAAVAWGLAALLDRVARFRALLSLLLYGELLLLLQGVFTALVLNLEGVEQIRAPSDLLVPWGVDMLVDLRSPAALAAAQHTTVFHLLWFAFLVYALPRVTGSSRGGAVFMALTLWAGIALFGVLRSMLAG